MTKRLLSFFTHCAAIPLVGAMALSGCGGGGGNNGNDVVNTSTGQNGRLEDVQVGPPAGSTYISKATSFQASWSNSAPPPSNFGAALIRYQEARGGEKKSVTSQKISVDRQGNSFSYNIARRDNFDLDGEGVYYLELTSPGSSTGRAAYIVSNDRSRFTPAPAAKTTRYFPTGGNGSLNGFEISPPPGTVSIPRSTTWRVRWTGNQEPPAQLDIRIYRYKEARGDAGQDINTQEETSTRPVAAVSFTTCTAAITSIWTAAASIIWRSPLPARRRIAPRILRTTIRASGKGRGQAPPLRR